MKRKHKIFQIIALAGFAWLFWQCAHQVTPTGGARDIEPPLVVSSEPPNKSIGFDSKRIVLSFNEFVKLDQPNQKVIISPPLKVMPEFRIRGKSVIIDIDEELNPNTTYSIFFGDAIVDITENNPISNYLYAFSTGDHIDTLSIAGEVFNAFDLKPAEDVFVMLYRPHNDTIPTDSLPILTRPMYIAKVGPGGAFRLEFLKDEEYKIFALKDMNSNYMFDQPNEEIAFLDTLIRPEVVVIPEPDSLPMIDTTTVEGLAMLDSIKLLVPDVHDLYHHYYHLLMFQQIDSTQRLLTKEMFYPPKFRMIYKFPARDPYFEVLNKTLPEDWKIEELGVNRDTLTVWARDINLDSLQIKIADGDSILDTTMIVFSREKPKLERKARKGKDDLETPDRLPLKLNAKGGRLDLGKRLVLTVNDPLETFSFDSVFFVAGEDTMTGAPFVQANASATKFTLDYEMVEETAYELIFPDSTLFDIYGLTNDSVQTKFSTKMKSDYGNLFLTIENPDSDTLSYPYIVQLLNQKEEVVRWEYVYRAGELSFENLPAAKYLLKAIQDFWPNKRWDTGWYLEKKQPENVFYFPPELQVRANWDMVESWQLP